MILPKTTTSDKVQLVKYPPALPGTCVVCGMSSNGLVSFVDFDFSIDHYGAVYFCSDCMGSIALSVGFYHAAVVLELEQENDSLRQNLLEAEDELTVIRDAYSHLGRIHFNVDDFDLETGLSEEQGDSGAEGDDSKTREND